MQPMSKSYYKNKVSGNYGFIDQEKISVQEGRGMYSLSLRLVKPVDGMVEPSHERESVVAENLVPVSPDEVQKALLPFLFT